MVKNCLFLFPAAMPGEGTTSASILSVHAPNIFSLRYCADCIWLKPEAFNYSPFLLYVHLVSCICKLYLFFLKFSHGLNLSQRAFSFTQTPWFTFTLLSHCCPPREKPSGFLEHLQDIWFIQTCSHRWNIWILCSKIRRCSFKCTAGNTSRSSKVQFYYDCEAFLITLPLVVAPRGTRPNTRIKKNMLIICLLFGCFLQVPTLCNYIHLTHVSWQRYVCVDCQWTPTEMRKAHPLLILLAPQFSKCVTKDTVLEPHW